jgi:hypothetical protein
MSRIFYSDFDDPLLADWTFTATPTRRYTGCSGLRALTCTTYGSGREVWKDFTDAGAEGALAFQYALYQNGVVANIPMMMATVYMVRSPPEATFPSGLNLQLYNLPDGSILCDTSNLVNVFTSAPGVLPTNGTWVTIDWVYAFSTAILPPGNLWILMTSSVAVNNVVVASSLSFPISLSATPGEQPAWRGFVTGGFIDLSSGVKNTAIDRIVVNNDAGGSVLSVCSGAIPLSAGTCGLTTPPAQGTIVVTKVVNPSSDPTEFDFTSTGLFPSTWTLGHGDSITFYVAAGSGYAIVETPEAGFNVAYNVSNGSLVSNITVADLETVTVTVTNTESSVTPPTVGDPGSGLFVLNPYSGITGLAPAKTSDEQVIDYNPFTTSEEAIPTPMAQTAPIQDKE